jgi:alpha-tubulin suppressor-like RCC1 family protein
VQAHACALFENGKVKCWGDGTYGALGYRHELVIGDKAFDMLKLGYLELGPERVKKISAGSFHTCALFENGKVKCWGSNRFGQIGQDMKPLASDPIQLEQDSFYLKLSNEKIISIDSGNYTSCALFESGNVKCWGENQYSQLGQSKNLRNIGKSGPNELFNLPNIKLGNNQFTGITTGYAHTCAFKSDAIYCFGLNTFGQLGHSFRTAPEAPGDDLLIPGYDTIVPPTVVQ